MEITLHIGAHRTGTTSFQGCLRSNFNALTKIGMEIWGPRLLRSRLFKELSAPNTQAATLMQARSRVQARLDQAEKENCHHLLVTEENMMGSVRGNIRTNDLYEDVGERIPRYLKVFDGRVSRIVVSIRRQDQYWASALAFGVGRGHMLPGQRRLDMIASTARNWREVISDIAGAAPGVEIIVAPFERFSGRPASLLAAATGISFPLRHPDTWLNRAPDAQTLMTQLRARGESAQLPQENGRWQPFWPVQSALLREAYVDDMVWLSQGAEGLARLVGDTQRAAAAPNAREFAHYYEGQGNDTKTGRTVA